MKKKKRTASILAAVLALTLAVSVPVAASEADESTGDETLRVVLGSEPPYLNALYNGFGDDVMEVSWLIADRLIDKDVETGEYVPSAATAWEWIDDTHLQVTLRDDIVAYDGTIFDSSDLLYDVQELAPLCVNQAVWASVDFEGCSAPDEHTFIFALKYPYPTFIDLLTGLYLLPLTDKSSIEAAGGWESDGGFKEFRASTGKYFVDEWVSGQYLTITRNENYWGEKPYYKHITFTFIGDSAARALAIQAGNVDVASFLNSAEKLSLSTDPKVKVESYQSDRSMLVWLNCSREPFNDPLVREAMFYLVDPNAFVIACTNGEALVAETIFSPTNSVYKPRVAGEEWVKDVAKAKELLSQAGYEDGFTFTLTTDAQFELGAQILQSFLREGGIETTIQLADRNLMGNLSTSGDYDAISFSSMGYDPARIIQRLDGRVPMEIRAGGPQYEDEALYDLIDTAYSAIDYEARKEAYGEIQDYVYDNHLCIGCYSIVYNFALNNNLTNVKWQNDGLLRIDLLRPEA